MHIKTAAGRNVQCNFENRQQFSCSSLRYAQSVGTCSRVIWHGSKMKAAFTRALQTFIFSNEIRLFDSFALDINWTLGVKRPVIGKSLLPQLGFFYNLKEVQESSFPLRPPVIMDHFPKDLKIGYLRRLLCCCGLICRQVNLCTSSHPLTYASSFLPFHSDWPKQDRRGHSPFATATRFRAGRSYRATLSQVRLVRPIHEGAWYVHPGLLSAHEAFVAINRELCHPSPFGIRL